MVPYGAPRVQTGATLGSLCPRLATLGPLWGHNGAKWYPVTLNFRKLTGTWRWGQRTGWSKQREKSVTLNLELPLLVFSLDTQGTIIIKWYGVYFTRLSCGLRILVILNLVYCSLGFFLPYY